MTFLQKFCLRPVAIVGCMQSFFFFFNPHPPKGMFLLSFRDRKKHCIDGRNTDRSPPVRAPTRGSNLHPFWRTGHCSTRAAWPGRLPGTQQGPRERHSAGCKGARCSGWRTGRTGQGALLCGPPAESVPSGPSGCACPADDRGSGNPHALIPRAWLGISVLKASRQTDAQHGVQTFAFPDASLCGDTNVPLLGLTVREEQQQGAKSAYTARQCVTLKRSQMALGSWPQKARGAGGRGKRFGTFCSGQESWDRPRGSVAIAETLPRVRWPRTGPAQPSWAGRGATVPKLWIRRQAQT